MGVRGLGVDVVALERFEEAVLRSPALLARVFTEAERTLPVQSLAGRWAAKEALAKALGAPVGLGWHDVEVVSEPGGQPRLEATGTVAARMAELGADSLFLSITHDAGVAVAVVIAEGGS